jgi:hypothetical protein
MKSEYIVTDKAGFEVAGRRSPGVGKSVFLTDKQAEHPLRLKEIARPTPAAMDSVTVVSAAVGTEESVSTAGRLSK